MKRFLPPTYESVVALVHLLSVDTPAGPGSAIATAFDGDGMLYLVVADRGDSAPRWVPETELTAARLTVPGGS